MIGLCSASRLRRVPHFRRMARLTSITVPLDERGHHDLEAMAEAAADARVVVLCRPHNPTGTRGACRRWQRFLRHVPNDTIVLLDEAYIEFVGTEHRIDGPNLVRRFPNVIVLRTFSKAYGLAGCGSVRFQSPELATILWKMQLPFGMGITSLFGVRRPTTPKTSCDNAFCESPVSGITCAGAFGQWVYTPPTGTRTSLTCRPSDDPGERNSPTPG